MKNNFFNLKIFNCADCTGFCLRPVAGLLSSRDFLAGNELSQFYVVSSLSDSAREHAKSRELWFSSCPTLSRRESFSTRECAKWRESFFRSRLPRLPLHPVHPPPLRAQVHARTVSDWSLIFWAWSLIFAATSATSCSDTHRCSPTRSSRSSLRYGRARYKSIGNYFG